MQDVPQIRRVVTGHDDKGRAIVDVGGVGGQFRPGRPKAFIGQTGTADTVPANNDGHVDGGKREGKFTHIENGSVFRILDFRPGVEHRMHRTDSTDYLVVMKGEIDMELDDGVEVHLKAGDVMVQRGTIHNWINRGTETCVIAVILIHAKPVEAGGQVLHSVG